MFENIFSKSSLISDTAIELPSDTAVNVVSDTAIEIRTSASQQRE